MYNAMERLYNKRMPLMAEKRMRRGNYDTLGLNYTLCSRCGDDDGNFTDMRDKRCKERTFKKIDASLPFSDFNTLLACCECTQTMHKRNGRRPKTICSNNWVLCTNCEMACHRPKKCARCQWVYYCSRECQVEHWGNNHRYTCISLCSRFI